MNSLSKNVALLFMILLSSQVYTQSTLYLPLEIQNAYQTGTRTFDGSPGENYWQNRSSYSIDAQVHPEKRIVSGDMHITYFNESPDTLYNVYLRLYQDVYKKGNARDFSIGDEDLHDGMILQEIKIITPSADTTDVTDNAKRYGTLCGVDLPQPLLTGDSVMLYVLFETILPAKRTIRMGYYGDHYMMVSYWYPQISVYDDIDGWDRTDYTGRTEFYNDCNNYDITITVPEDYLIWATGVLQNPEDVYAEHILEKYNTALESDSIINIVDSTDRVNGIVTKKEEVTYHFLADEVPDFTFAVSDKHLWDGSSLLIEETGKRVFIDAAYLPESEQFYYVAEIARNTIKLLSEGIPGYPYPYPKMTIFNGSGGMESPMMVNDGTTYDWISTVHLTSHEITHTYFPFYTGSNEVKYAWMDEGMATMLPFELQKELAPGYNPFERNIATYLDYAGRELETPPMVLSYNLRGKSYRIASYRRSGIAFEYLKDFLGRDLFKKALRIYTEEWKNKHPLPYDFFHTFDRVVGENLDWFWKPWFFEFGYPDLAIKEVTQDENIITVTVKKIGTLPVPIQLSLITNSGTIDKYLPADVWKDGNSTYQVTLEVNTGYHMIRLGSPKIADVNLKNNAFFND